MIVYECIRAKRKTISLSVSNELQVVVRAPYRLSKMDIERFVDKHLDWIEKKKQQICDRRAQAITLTESQINEMKRKAKEILPERVAYFSSMMGVSPAAVKITSAKRSWGSCIHKCNTDTICFSFRVMLLPEDLIDYIVVHELAHIRVRNHSKEFYDEVAKYVSDYPAKNQMLRQISIMYT